MPRLLQLTILPTVMLAIAFTTAAQAEHWVKSAAVPGIPKYGVADTEMCVDMDSVKTLPDGWTYYRDRDCADAKSFITENMTLCSQEFSGKSYHAQERIFEREKAWRTLDKETAAPVGVTARFVCHK